jgi:hypothetical protein
MENPDELIDNKFPLFSLLYEKTNDNPLEQMELIELIENIRKLDRQGFDLIFLIVRLYSLRANQTSSSNVFDIPYSGEKVKDTEQVSTDASSIKMDIKFDIRNFPNRLNRMLLEFSKMRLEQM